MFQTPYQQSYRWMDEKWISQWARWGRKMHLQKNKKQKYYTLGEKKREENFNENLNSIYKCNA